MKTKTLALFSALGLLAPLASPSYADTATARSDTVVEAAEDHSGTLSGDRPAFPVTSVSDLSGAIDPRNSALAVGSVDALGPQGVELVAAATAVGFSATAQATQATQTLTYGALFDSTGLGCTQRTCFAELSFDYLASSSGLLGDGMATSVLELAWRSVDAQGGVSVTDFSPTTARAFKRYFEVAPGGEGELQITLTTEAGAWDGAARGDADVSLRVAAVPEPSTTALAALACLLVGLRRRARG